MSTIATNYNRNQNYNQNYNQNQNTPFQKKPALIRKRPPETRAHLLLLLSWWAWWALAGEGGNIGSEADLSIEDVKSWMMEYAEQRRHVDLLIERASALEMQIESPRSPQLDGMPHGSGRAYDPIGEAITRLDDLKEQITAGQETERQLYRERDAVIDQITGKRWVEWRAVLKMRYLDGMAWENICFSLFGSRDDYNDKEESYQRRTFTLHKEALKQLSLQNPLHSGRNEG